VSWNKHKQIWHSNTYSEERVSTGRPCRAYMGFEKGKGTCLTVRSSALQPWKWQLTGIGYSSAARTSGTHWTHSYAARHTTPQSSMLGLHPVIHVPNYMDYYSFTDP